MDKNNSSFSDMNVQTLLSAISKVGTTIESDNRIAHSSIYERIAKEKEILNTKIEELHKEITSNHIAVTTENRNRDHEIEKKLILIERDIENFKEHLRNPHINPENWWNSKIGETTKYLILGIIVTIFNQIIKRFV